MPNTFLEPFKRKILSCVRHFSCVTVAFLPNLVIILLSSKSSVSPGVPAQRYSSHLTLSRVFNTSCHFFGETSIDVISSIKVMYKHKVTSSTKSTAQEQHNVLSDLPHSC